MQFLTLFSFFANNSRMKQPTPVFLSYMDFPYAIEGGSTIKFFWVLNKLYMAKREAILRNMFGTSKSHPAILALIAREMSL